MTRAEACLSCCSHVFTVLSIFSQNITLTEQGASSLCLPLLPFGTAHMTEAAAADYTFSCDGTAPLPLHPPLSLSLSINLFKTQGSQLILSSGFSSSFILFLLFPPPLYFLCFHGVPSSSLFCSYNVQSISLLSNCCLSPSTECVTSCCQHLQ